MKHIEIVMKQRPQTKDEWAGSWFAMSLAGYRSGGFSPPSSIGSVTPLTYDQCLVAAIARAQELGYDSFSITTHPQPDYAEDEGGLTDLHHHAHEALAKMMHQHGAEIGSLKGECRHLDKTIDLVSQRVDAIEAKLDAMNQALESVYFRG